MTKFTTKLILAISGTVEAEAWVQDAFPRHTMNLDGLDLAGLRAEALATASGRRASNTARHVDGAERPAQSEAERRMTIIDGPQWLEIEGNDDWVLVVLLDAATPAPLELMDLTRAGSLKVQAVFCEEFTEDSVKFGTEYHAGTARMLEPAESEAVVQAAGPLLYWAGLAKVA